MSAGRLASSSSAYLRQHADNPVEWYAWGDEPFERARREDRPVFISIGYAACHWCHVMAHESFEDPAVAALLNDHFIPIKVDREERPDVDAYYMAATQAVTGSGGWPMSVFVTPDRRPFFAGTYFPPTSRHGQPGFTDLLHAITDAWGARREDVTAQADQLATAIEREVTFVDHLTPSRETMSFAAATVSLTTELCERLHPHGGFSGAPKFPRPSYVEALLTRWDDADCRAAATLTLDAMCHGGIYDHIGGGFARYSVDANWRVPHFEKMLSDQALLATCYLRADRVAGGGTPWRAVALDTLRFVLRDLAVPDGFASSLDADTTDGEGAHVTWTDHEVSAVLRDAGIGALVDDALARWHIGPPGDLEGRSVPHLDDDQPFVTPSALRDAQRALLAARSTRPAPGRDDKVVLEWNAMVAAALCESDEPSLVHEGLRLLDRLSGCHDAGTWWRTTSRSAPATCADVAWLLDALVSAFEATGDDSWLATAAPLVGVIADEFWDGEVPTDARPHGGGGVFSAGAHGELPVRGKEVFDGATPSAHSVAATALARFALVTGDGRARALSARLVEIAAPLLEAHAIAVPDLVRALGFVTDGREIVVPGPRGDLGDLVRSRFVPASVLVTGTGSSPLLADREVGAAYVCRAQVCDLPARSVADLAAQLDALTRS